MTYWKILDECATIAKEREEQYGNFVDNFEQVKEVYDAISSTPLTVKQIFDVLIAVKLARRKFNPAHMDNDLDIINYMAMGAQIKVQKGTAKW